MAGELRLKRIYEAPSPGDGTRVLVERLWPRGVTKRRASLDLWLREVAPSPALRRWYDHEPARWEEFVRRYWAELSEHRSVVGMLRKELERGNVTLVYAAADVEHNSALALKRYLEQR